MKKFIGSVAVMVIFSLLLHAMANAQLNTLSTSLASENLNSVSAAKASAKVAVSKAKAEKNFKKNYKTSSNVVWTSDDKSIHAYYNENGIATRIAYDNKGRWFRTIKTYEADKLEKRVSGAVKRQFKGYTITCINDVQEGTMHCYFLNIVKDKDFKQVIFYQGEITVHEQFQLQ
jgi:quinolinate synthase